MIPATRCFVGFCVTSVSDQSLISNVFNSVTWFSGAAGFVLVSLQAIQLCLSIFCWVISKH